MVNIRTTINNRLENIPDVLHINNKQLYPKIRPGTQIVDVIGLGLSMSQSSILSWPKTETIIVQLPEVLFTEPKYRVDCHPDSSDHFVFKSISSLFLLYLDMTSNNCIARGCSWDITIVSDYPTCYIPKEKGGYSQTDSTKQLTDAVTRYTLSRLSTKPSMYGNDIDHLNVEVSISGTDMIRLTIRDADKQRYEVPVPIQWQASLPSSTLKAKLKFELTKTSNEQASFRVKRTDTQSIIFDTSYFSEGFIYDNQYIQLITTVPSRNVYGFGENTHPTFRRILNNSSRYEIFARDQPPHGENENLYGTHPFYISIEEDGQTFGVLIFNSNAQDYKLNEYEDNQSMLTYRTLGGILDLFVFAGPRPEDVIRQYQMVIGKPYMPPYWALGFQLCRYGYNTLDNMKAAMQRTLDGNIPLDVMEGKLISLTQFIDLFF